MSGQKLLHSLLIPMADTANDILNNICPYKGTEMVSTQIKETHLQPFAGRTSQVK